MRALRTQPTPLRHALRALRAASSRRVGPAMTRAHVDFRDIKATGDAYVQAPEMAALLAKGPDVVVRRQSPGAAATDRAWHARRSPPQPRCTAPSSAAGARVAGTCWRRRACSTEW